MGVDLETWGKSLVERVNEKVKHVTEKVDQRLGDQEKFIQQRVDHISAIQEEKHTALSNRLEEALIEIRGYKDILQQQLTVVDEAVKHAHQRIDEGDTDTQQDVKRLEALEKTLASVEETIKKLQEADLIETTQREARQTDPIRVFIRQYGQRVLAIILGGIGVYLLRNLSAIMDIID